MLRAYQHEWTVCDHIGKGMSHSVFPLVRHKLPVTLTRHTRGLVGPTDRGNAAHDITESKHRVPFSRPCSLRSPPFGPLIRTMARIAVFAHNDFISALILISCFSNKTKRSTKSFQPFVPRQTKSTRLLGYEDGSVQRKTACTTR
jgi:hypothetical protein